MPVATEVLSGEKADDPVYLPIIVRAREGISKSGLLSIGDCKMGALQTRASIQFHGHTLCMSTFIYTSTIRSFAARSIRSDKKERK
jgi:transposase